MYCMFSGQVKEESLEELPFPLNLLPQELQLQQQQQLLMYCIFSGQVKEERLEELQL